MDVISSRIKGERKYQCTIKMNVPVDWYICLYNKISIVTSEKKIHLIHRKAGKGWKIETTNKTKQNKMANLNLNMPISLLYINGLTTPIKRQRFSE